MNYEERYKKALKVIEELYTLLRYQSSTDALLASQTIEKAFPELRESEDERIRKDIIAFLKADKPFADNETLGNWIAWLEKQGEKSEYNPYKATVESIAEMCKSYSTSTDLHDFYDNVRVKCKDAMEYDKTWTEKQGEQKPTDEIKPKFKVGDWITNGEHTWKVTDIKPLDYILQSQNGDVVDDTISYVDKEFHLWTIQDAKEGDVLATDSGRPFIFKGLLDMYHPKSPVAYCGIAPDNSFDNNSDENNEWWTAENVYPATKEQFDLLFSKMKEASYEWDAEKKELKKIEQKPSWSKEDEKIYSLIYSAIKNDTQIASPSNKKDAIDWLKSLKSKKHWKPSEKQMEALKKRIHVLHTSSETRKALESLIDDLTKL